MMVAATVFFLMESMAVGNHWKTSMNVGALVTLVAAVHYFYMREFWVQIHASPILYRYIDWSITVPLQMIEFNLILKAVNPNIGAGMFWRLMIGTIAMLLFGYCGETSIIGAWVGFALGLSGWGFILSEIFVGEAGQCAGQSGGGGGGVGPEPGGLGRARRPAPPGVVPGCEGQPRALYQSSRCWDMVKGPKRGPPLAELSVVDPETLPICRTPRSCQARSRRTWPWRPRPTGS